MNISETLTSALSSVALSQIIPALITLLVCLLVIRAAIKMIQRLVGHTKLDERVKKYMVHGIKLLLYLLTAIIVLEKLGVKMTSLVALLSVGSLGITLAAEDILGNVAGGIVIFSSHPFELGDYVEADGVGGTVDEINLNHTKFLTADGQYVLVPNRSLSSSKITNYTRLGRRRIGIKVTASYDAPTKDVFAACADAIEMTPNILTDPAPVTRLTEYGSSSIGYAVYCWTAVGDYWDSYYALMENLRTAFEKHNVEMTYDHLNVHVVEK